MGSYDTMTSWGYTLSSEEHGPRRLVDCAVQAETAGFEFLDFWARELQPRLASLEAPRVRAGR